LRERVFLNFSLASVSNSMGVAGEVIADANTSTVTTSVVQDSSADVMSFVDEVPTQIVSRVSRPFNLTLFLHLLSCQIT
jgi:hypothetical protein